MDLLLTILKFLGIAVSVVSGVLGTLTRTHEEKINRPNIYGGETRTERKLTRWGTVSLSLTILGSVVATGALIAESLKKQHDDAESRKRTEQQIGQGKEVLKRLDDLTPLGLIDISATYEIPTNLPWASKLLHHVAPQAARVQRLSATLDPAHTPDAIHSIVVPPSAHPNELRLTARILHDGRNLTLAPKGRGRAGVFGYMNFPSDTNVTLVVNPDESFFLLGPDDIPGVTHYLVGTNVQTLVCADSLTNEFWMTALKSEGRGFLTMWKHTAMLLTTPDIRLEFTRKGANPDSSSPDLTISLEPEGIRTALLSYSPESGKLTFLCDFSSSSANGGKSQTIRSTPELAEATPRISSWFPFASWGIRPSDCLRQASLGVRGSTLILTKFHALAYRDDTWVEATTLYGTNIVSDQVVH
jgi:hypothetical protein